MTPSSPHISSRRSSISSNHSTSKRPSVSSIIARTRDASLAKLGLRSTPLTPTPEQQPVPSTTIYNDDDDDENSHPTLSSEYFKRYELLTEFINLRNPSHCPLGVYIIPSSDNLNVMYGVVFVHKGYYRSGVFKFRMFIPETYPDHPPSVTFLTDMFHPLVDSQGNVSLSQQFPTWRPHQDYLFHVLHYIKNMFKRVILEKLVDKHCYNKEAYRLFRNDTSVFSKLSQQCAQLSITESYLFDHFPDNNMIRFSSLSEPKFEELRSIVFKSSTAPPE
ncbi:ubiquitin-conjugating enzyme/RWD-like protein [Cunninghamella echinulata]|nr:ubiquitin-conjugating enzyme/RWD-like protein [Cunninghamella echinulata]